MNVLLINVLLALIWAFLKESITLETLFEGLVIGYLILWLASPLFGASAYFRKFRQAVSFFLFFVRELTFASLRVVLWVVQPTFNMRPGIVAIPLDIKTDAEITMLANLITLTPGTLTLDVSDDRQVMYVHALDVGDVDEFRRSIKQGFEKRVGELFS